MLLNRNYDVIKLTGTTNGSGAATVTTDRKITGEVVGVFLDAGDLDATGDVTLSAVYTLTDGTTLAEAFLTRTNVGNSTVIDMPLHDGQNATGGVYDADATQADTQKAPVLYPLIEAKLRAVVAQGGDTLPFAVHILVRT